jgi:hypothetical protein
VTKRAELFGRFRTHWQKIRSVRLEVGSNENLLPVGIGYNMAGEWKGRCRYAMLRFDPMSSLSPALARTQVSIRNSIACQIPRQADAASRNHFVVRFSRRSRFGPLLWRQSVHFSLLLSSFNDFVSSLFGFSKVNELLEITLHPRTRSLPRCWLTVLILLPCPHPKPYRSPIRHTEIPISFYDMIAFVCLNADHEMNLKAPNFPGLFAFSHRPSRSRLRK